MSNGSGNGWQPRQILHFPANRTTDFFTLPVDTASQQTPPILSVLPRITLSPMTLARQKADEEHEKQFVDQKDTDVVFICTDDRKIGAHSYMLKARSSVLRANLKTGWIKGNEIMAYFRYEVLYEVLRFIYASKVNRLPELAEDLLKAADVYDLDGLKLICESAMVKSLTTSNSIARFLLSIQYRVGTLEREASKIINKNAAELIKTSDWANLTPEHIMKLYYAHMDVSSPLPKRIKTVEGTATNQANTGIRPPNRIRKMCSNSKR